MSYWIIWMMGVLITQGYNTVHKGIQTSRIICHPISTSSRFPHPSTIIALSTTTHVDATTWKQFSCYWIPKKDQVTGICDVFLVSEHAVEQTFGLLRMSPMIATPRRLYVVTESIGLWSPYKQNLENRRFGNWGANIPILIQLLSEQHTVWLKE